MGANVRLHTLRNVPMDATWTTVESVDVTKATSPTTITIVRRTTKSLCHPFEYYSAFRHVHSMYHCIGGYGSFRNSLCYKTSLLLSALYFIAYAVLCYYGKKCYGKGKYVYSKKD